MWGSLIRLGTMSLWTCLGRTPLFDCCHSYVSFVGKLDQASEEGTDGRDDVTVRNGGGQYSALGEKGNRGQETTVLSDLVSDRDTLPS